MGEPAPKLKYTFAEYIALEEQSDIKHDFINGEIYATAHGTPEHGRLAMRIGRILGNALRGRPCEVFSSDVRLRVLATGLATYPDVSVVCNRLEIDPEHRNTITNPVVIVEVLSDSTAEYDRKDKFRHYRRIPSLRDYVLVDQHEPRIEHYQRNDDDTWTLREVAPPGAVRLSMGVEISVAEVYENALSA
jgi:Uma2 family endonuclease